MLRNKRCGVEF